MSITPDFSIIVPTHGRHELLSETLTSLRMQTHTNWECLIVSDYPQEFDSKKAMILELGDDRFSFHSNYHPGSNASRNTGLRSCNGNIVLFLDDDDMLCPEFLQHHLFAHKRADIVYATTIQQYEAGKKTLRCVQNVAPQIPADIPLAMRQFFWCPLTFSAKRSLIGETEWDETLESYHDWAFWYDIFSKNPRTARISKPLFIYRQHHGTRDSRNMLKRIRCLEQLFTKLSNQGHTDHITGFKKQALVDCYFFIRNSPYHLRVRRIVSCIKLDSFLLNQQLPFRLVIKSLLFPSQHTSVFFYLKYIKSRHLKKTPDNILFP